MRIVDNLIAIRILWMLVTPFEKTTAYKLGLISADGEIIKKAKTSEETNATSMLHRLVWRVKRFINLVPGGKTTIGSIIAAYALVRENHAMDNYYPDLNQLDEQFERRIGYASDPVLVEIVENLMEDAPANATGVATSTDQAAIKPRLKKFKTSNKPFSTLKNGKTTTRRIGAYLDLSTESDQTLFNHITATGNGTILIEHGNDTMGLKFYMTEPPDNRTPKQLLDSWVTEWNLEVLKYD